VAEQEDGNALEQNETANVATEAGKEVNSCTGGCTLLFGFLN